MSTESEEMSLDEKKEHLNSVRQKRREQIGRLHELNNRRNELRSIRDKNNQGSKTLFKEAKTSREKRYTPSGKINKDWKRRCTITLRRISVINAHLSIIENSVELFSGNDKKIKQNLDILIEEKQYRDKLMDMSNFYARYLSSYQYDYVIKTQD